MISASTKPYLIRAIYDWCVDNGHTPYLLVRVNANTRVPMEHVRNGEIVLNIGPSAAARLVLGAERVEFAARFNGVSREILVPVEAVGGIFARENSQGMFFPPEEAATVDLATESATPDTAPDEPTPPQPTPPKPGRPKLQVVK